MSLLGCGGVWVYQVYGYISISVYSLAELMLKLYL